ncbi:MAG: hypothetical protein H0X47_06200 [Nitrospirales bacterium]|nr:hypothetical protein [Nitrospirales bacterium]
MKPLQTVDVYKDDTDYRVLECAEAGQDECIVTGDKAMLRLKQLGVFS